MLTVPSVLCRCWLVGRKGIRPVKNWVVGCWWVVIWLEWGADLHMIQLMPLPLTVSCFSKIQIGFSFLVLAHPGSPRQKAMRACVCLQYPLCLLSNTGRCNLPKLFLILMYQKCTSVCMVKCYRTILLAVCRHTGVHGARDVWGEIQWECWRLCIRHVYAGDGYERVSVQRMHQYSTDLSSCQLCMYFDLTANILIKLVFRSIYWSVIMVARLCTVWLF